MKEVIINKRRFLQKMSDDTFVFDRSYPNNKIDIASSAALALHKAIIGICGLSSLEKAEQVARINLRSSKAVQTYYVLYHLFTCCMLLDDDYEITFKSKYGHIKYGTELNDLKKSPRKPHHWNSRKNMEMDLAVRITHGEIKKYCNALRKRASSKEVPLSPFLSILHDAFVSDSCRLILFEKADYIRDRAIYRPSHVSSFTDTPIQTSKNTREQIDSMPDSETIHLEIQRIINAIWAISGDRYYSFGFSFTHEIIDCPTDYAQVLGYNWDELESYGGSKTGNYVPSYICQLMELYTPAEVASFYQRYWLPVLNEANKRWFEP